MYVFKYPSVIGIEITNRCNLNCIHCINSSSINDKQELSFDTIKLIIDYMHQHGIICLDISGGEPFLHPRIYDILEYAYSRNLNISMATNGTFLTQDNINILKQYSVSTRVSYDGYNEDTFSIVRGKGIYQKVYNNVKNAIISNLGITLVTVLHANNVDNVELYIKTAKELGVRKLRLMPFVPDGRGSNSGLKFMSPLQWKYILENYEKWAKYYGIKIALDSPLMSITHHLVCPCVVGKFYLVIKSNGDAVPCALLDMPIGNIYHNTIDEIWQSPTLTEINDISLLNEECHQCEYLQACAGGCRGMAYKIKGSYLCKDPLCWLQSQNK
ncbi:MAG: radical SAM protein [Bacteroidales bacterium]|nr:radical SAM protein [Bacteroidales bacterium]